MGAAAAAAAAGHLGVRFHGEAVVDGVAAGAAPVDGDAAVAHAYAHVLGLPVYGASRRLVAGLPRSDVFGRPVGGLFVTSEAGGAGLLPGAPAVQLLSSSVVDALHLAGSVVWGGADAAAVSAASLDVVAGGLPARASSTAAHGGAVLQWTGAAAGFAGAAEGTPFAALAGNVACGPAGSALLARVGLSVKYVRSGSGSVSSCPAYTSADSAVELDAAHPAVAQALSEVAAVVAVADAAAGGVAAASSGASPVVYRVYTSGIAQAAEAGVPAAALDALRALLARAVALADAALAAAASSAGRSSASVVLSTVGVPGAVTGRRLLDADDPCIDFGNCTSPSPSPGWVPPSVSTVTEAQIESYHVVLWTSVLLALVLGATVATLLGMDAVKEPALYAQLADPRAGSGAAAKAR